MRRAEFLPALLVAALAMLGPLLEEQGARCPAGSDGPQFACWLEQHPEQLER